MAFRPCIDLRNGKVVQIVGGTLTDNEDSIVTNFTAERDSADYSVMYKNDGLIGGHIIMLGPGNETAATAALNAYPGGMQIGGGITPENALRYLKEGASHIIVTSYLFINDELSFDRVKEISDLVGPDKLVIDLSCRKISPKHYRVAINRWQTVTETVLDDMLFEKLAPYCSEFLIHAADVEGKCEGIDHELVSLLGNWATHMSTYAGGAKSFSDISLVEELSAGKVDLTIGSALDIFGGKSVLYSEAAKLGRKL